MGRASKKDWYSEIACMQNIFAVRLNPICLESKLGRSIHNMLCHWVTCLWETKMTQSLNEYIFKKEVYNKLDKLELKENVAINTVHECLSNNNIDEELATLIKEYQNTYIFLFSSVFNTIYFNTKKSKMLNGIIKHYVLWARYKDDRERFTSPFHLHFL